MSPTAVRPVEAARKGCGFSESWRYPVPQAVLADVRHLCARYGRLRLVADDPAVLAEVSRAPSVATLLGAPLGASR